MIGIAAANGLSAHAAQVWNMRRSLAWALPLGLLVAGPAAGFPGHRPAFDAHLSRGVMNIPASAACGWLEPDPQAASSSFGHHDEADDERPRI